MYEPGMVGVVERGLMNKKRKPYDLFMAGFLALIMGASSIGFSIFHYVHSYRPTRSLEIPVENHQQLLKVLETCLFVVLPVLGLNFLVVALLICKHLRASPNIHD